MTEANTLDLRPSFIALEEFLARLNHTTEYDDADKAITKFTSIIQRLAAEFGRNRHACCECGSYQVTLSSPHTH